MGVPGRKGHRSARLGVAGRDLDLELQLRDRERVLLAALLVQVDREGPGRCLDRLHVEAERIEGIHVDLAADGRLGSSGPATATTTGAEDEHTSDEDRDR